MAQKWYVVHTYSGFRKQGEIRSGREDQLGEEGGFFSEILVPAEKVIEMVKGKKKASSRKFFPAIFG